MKIDLAKWASIAGLGTIVAGVVVFMVLSIDRQQRHAVISRNQNEVDRLNALESAREAQEARNTAAHYGRVLDEIEHMLFRAQQTNLVAVPVTNLKVLVITNFPAEEWDRPMRPGPARRQSVTHK